MLQNLEPFTERTSTSLRLFAWLNEAGREREGEDDAGEGRRDREGKRAASMLLACGRHLINLTITSIKKLTKRIVSTTHHSMLSSAAILEESFNGRWLRRMSLSGGEPRDSSDLTCSGRFPEGSAMTTQATHEKRREGRKEGGKKDGSRTISVNQGKSTDQRMELDYSDYEGSLLKIQGVTCGQCCSKL